MCVGKKSEPASTTTVTTGTTTNSAQVKPAAPAGAGATKESTKDTPATPSNPLTIGTKKYRNDSGLGSSGLAIGGSPSGISLAK